jgi:putative transposase
VTVAFIDAHRDRFEVAAMCRVLGFPERTFYAFKARPICARATADAAHKTLILDEWTANYSCYGARRMHKHLRRQGHRIARCMNRPGSDGGSGYWFPTPSGVGCWAA